MITMAIINNIRYLTKIQRLSYSKIKKITGCAYETIKKYEELEDLTPVFKNPIKKKTKLEDFEQTIRKWILEDKGRPYKQRHTARKVHYRLLEEHPDTYTASYRTVANYLSKLKKELGIGGEEYIKLQHPEDEAQVDFGKASFYENGELIEGSYLVLTLPYSNAGFIQLFHGETQECLLEGLKNIFNHMGRVPTKIWFDNLTAAVKVINKKNRKLNSFFEMFSAHYGYEPVFCNPGKGNEKGNVENKVGYLRRNLLVPLPDIKNLSDFNKELLKKCDTDHDRIHYEKREKIKDLYTEQLSLMQQLNLNEFDVFRLEKRKSNKYGNIEVETNTYSVSPSYKNEELWARIEANRITILDNDGKELIKHKRCYKKNQTIINHQESLPLIIEKINSLKYSGFYESLPKVWKEQLQDKDKESTKKNLKVLSQMLLESTIDVATTVLEKALVSGKTAPDEILASFYKYVEKDVSPKEIEFDELPELAQTIEAYDIDLDKYNKFLGRNL